MKYLITPIFLIALIGCSQKDAEEFAFRKTIEYDLVEKCADDSACIKAVKTQIPGCMEKSDWYRFVENEEDSDELRRFVTLFYACIVDANGDPYFEPSI